MNDNSDDDVEDLRGRRDKEITLGTTMVLAIFFGLAVLCAVFFGFGYSIGSKRVIPTSGPTAASSGSTIFNGFKPAAGSAAGGAGKTPAVDAASVPYTPPPATVSVPRTPVEKLPQEPAEVLDVPARTTPPVAHPLPVAVVSPVAPPTGQMMVQVAAVSHQEDADLLVTTLKRRNYAVAIHSEPQDKLLHVQVGPFTTKKDADAMRQRLQADGFNAIVKEPSH